MLKENPETKEGELDYDEYRDKYRSESIIKSPDLYAKRSKSFTTMSIVMTAAAVGVVACLAVPMIMAAAAVIPVIGAAAWAGGFALAAGTTLAGAAAVGGTLFSLGVSSFLAYKTATGLDVRDFCKI